MRLRLPHRAARPGWAVVPGERVLAAARVAGEERWLLGTRRRLALVSAAEPMLTWTWDQIQAMDWKAEEHTLRWSPIGSFGEVRESAAYKLVDADLLLQLVRERITASILFERHEPVRGKLGFRVIARRNPGGGPLTWMCDFDPGVEPEAPGMPERVEAALARAQAEIGEPI